MRYTRDSREEFRVSRLDYFSLSELNTISDNLRKEKSDILPKPTILTLSWIYSIFAFLFIIGGILLLFFGNPGGGEEGIPSLSVVCMVVGFILMAVGVYEFLRLPIVSSFHQFNFTYQEIDDYVARCDIVVCIL